MLPYFPYILFLEKNNLNKIQITPNSKKNSKEIFNLILRNSQLIFHNLKKSFCLHSWKSLSCLSFWIGNVLKWNSNIFNTPCHLNKWKKSCHIFSRVLWWKEFEFMENINAKMKVWESPFIPSHLTFRKVSNFTEFHTINQIYLFIITFQNLVFWDVTNLPPLKWISSSRFGEASKK